MVAPEDLGELGRLAVADRRGHVLDRKRAVEQELGGARHPDALELAAEAGAAGLGERALELAREVAISCATLASERSSSP